jgi:hypothetical protein
MNRWLLAVALLLAGALSLAQADYIRIRYVLSVSRDGRLVTNSNTGSDQGGEDLEGPSGRRRGFGPGRGPGGPPNPPPSRRPPGADNPALSTAPVETEPLKAEAVVEYTKNDNLKLSGPRGMVPFPRIYHKWGRTGLMISNDWGLSAIQENGRPVPAIAKRFEAKKKELLKGAKGDDRTDHLLELAKWALVHGMVDEVPQIIKDIAKAKPSDPIVKAFQQVQADMSRPVTRDDETPRWKEKLGNYRITQTAHYTLLYNAPSSDSAEVKSLEKQLEDTYKGFFYWFALRGVTLPVPDQRMVVVLVDRPEEFQVHRQVFDNAPLVADGFYPRRDNLLIFSAVRLDATYDALTKITQNLWANGWSKDRLLHGEGKARATPEEVVRNQMFALLMKALQEESTAAAVTHLGSVRLATATDLLPRYVEVPQWIQFGLGSYFETPEGAYWPGFGAPSWLYLPQWKLLDDTKRLDPAEDALKNVVTDNYFHQVGSIAPKDALKKARTYTWSLYYFLAEMKADGLMKYFDEIRRLPRDIQFSEDVLLGCFIRAFDLTETDNVALVNPIKFSKFAHEWYDFMHFSTLEASEAFIKATKELIPDKQGGKKPPTQ